MRRGKQFNSMVYEDKDAFNHMGRYGVLISRTDARRQGVDEGNFLVEKGIYESFVEMPDYVTDVKLEKTDHFNANKDRQYYERPIPDLEDDPN